MHILTHTQTSTWHSRHKERIICTIRRRSLVVEFLYLYPGLAALKIDRSTRSFLITIRKVLFFFFFSIFIYRIKRAQLALLSARLRCVIGHFFFRNSPPPLGTFLRNSPATATGNFTKYLPWLGEEFYYGYPNLCARVNVRIIHRIR